MASPISVPPSMSNAVKGNPPAVWTKVLILDKAAFLLVPPAPSSTIIKSEVVKSAPISVAPSMSRSARGTPPSGNTGL